MKRLILEMERIPSSVFSQSVFTYCRDNKKGGIWKKIKEDLIKKEGKKCWICGYDKDDAKLQAHETWSYDYKNKIMKLESIHHLCMKCHMLKHPLLFRIGDELIKHFCKVNNCTKDDFKNHSEETERKFIERSKIKWKQDFSIVDKYLMS